MAGKSMKMGKRPANQVGQTRAAGSGGTGVPLTGSGTKGPGGNRSGAKTGFGMAPTRNSVKC